MQKLQLTNFKLRKTLLMRRRQLTNSQLKKPPLMP